MAGVKRELIIPRIDITGHCPDKALVEQRCQDDISKFLFFNVRRHFSGSYDQKRFEKFVEWYRGFQREYAKSHPGYAEAHPDDFRDMEAKGGEIG